MAFPLGTLTLPLSLASSNFTVKWLGVVVCSLGFVFWEWLDSEAKCLCQLLKISHYFFECWFLFCLPLSLLRTAVKCVRPYYVHLCLVLLLIRAFCGYFLLKITLQFRKSLFICIKSDGKLFMECFSYSIFSNLSFPSSFFSFHVLCWSYESFNFLNISSIVTLKAVSHNGPSRPLPAVCFYCFCFAFLALWWYCLILCGFGYFYRCSRYCNEKL